ncbi:MAG: hypothetical protein IPP25_15030 [Saprospiraceae bacterium]|nr:hypothetical protein [Candidatus Opimibacter skivensis]
MLPESGTAFECYVLSHMVDDFLFERGWGVVINLKGNQPDWLLTYGDVVNYKLRRKNFILHRRFSVAAYGSDTAGRTGIGGPAIRFAAAPQCEMRCGNT